MRAIAVVLCLISPAMALAQCQLDVVRAPNGMLGDDFGAGMAVFGGRLHVCAPSLPIGGNQTGSICIFERAVDGKWDYVTEVHADGVENLNYYTGPILVHEDTLLAGALERGIGPGGVIVFEQSGDTLVPAQILRGTSNAHQFGVSMALDGQRLIVGSPGEGPCCSYSGAAYVFEKDPSGTWVQVARLTPPSAVSHFADTVAITGNYAFAFQDVIGIRIFENVEDGWTLRETLPQQFGSSAYGKVMFAAEGRLYVGRQTGVDVWVNQDGVWSIEQTVSAPTHSNGSFGASVIVNGDRMVVGDTRGDSANGETGLAHVYQQVDGTWNHVAELHPTDTREQALFGTTVALDENRVLVSAFPDTNVLGVPSGTVYEFDTSGGPLLHVVTEPEPIRIRAGETANFATTATGAGPIQFAWDRNGLPLFDGDRIIGAGTASLTLAATVPSDAGLYNVRVTGTCGEYESNSARLIVSCASLGFDRVEPISGLAAGESVSSVKIDGDRGLASIAAGSVVRVASIYRDGGLWTVGTGLDRGNVPPGAGFGNAVALAGIWAAVSAPLEDVNTRADAGAVYVYELVGDTWIQRQRLIAPIPNAAEHFGSQVHFSGGSLLVSAPGNRVAGAPLGEIVEHRFAGGQWVYASTIRTPSEVTTNDIDSLPLVDDLSIFVNASVIGPTLIEMARENQVWVVRSVLPNLSSDALRVDTATLSPDRSTLAVAGTAAYGSARREGIFVFERTMNGWLRAGHFTPYAPITTGTTIGPVRFASDELLYCTGFYNVVDGRVILLAFRKIGGAWQQVGDRVEPAFTNLDAGTAFVLDGTWWVPYSRSTGAGSDAPVIVGYDFSAISPGLDAELGTIVTPPGQAVVLAPPVSAPAPAQFQWYRDGVSLSDDGRILGATTPELRIVSAVAADAGEYSLEIGGPCGAARLHAATLEVVAPPCPADLNGDGIVDLFDLATLLTHFGEVSGATRETGDTDADSDVDLTDLATLLIAFGAPCAG